MKLIEDRTDIETFVNEFYERVKYDSVIQHFFTPERGFSFEQHIPIMCDFWKQFYSMCRDIRAVLWESIS
jgi:truncated hemoglobin YjbI